jgi:ADP-ribose pyrophosphatase
LHNPQFLDWGFLFIPTLEKPFTLNSRREIYKGRVVNLIVDSITTAQGVDTVREVFQHPGGAAVIPLFPDGDVLLVKQFRYPMQESLLEFPAGKIELGELPETTAHRELAEEVGYTSRKLNKIAEFYTTPGFCDERLFLYLAEELEPCEKMHDEDEEIEIVRVSLDALPDLIQAGEIVDAKTIIGIQQLLLSRIK